MSNDDKKTSALVTTNRSLGPKFEESDAFKAVSLHAEENLKQGRKKEEKRQKRMSNLRELNKPEIEHEEKDDVFF